MARGYEDRAVRDLAFLFLHLLATVARLAGPVGAARTVAELGIHQYDADTILRKIDEIEGYQRQRAASRR